jgi:hypothetical protein
MASPLGGMRLAPAADVAEGTTHTHVNAVRSPELLRSYS